MRKTILVLVLIAVAWLGLLAWPIQTLGTLARAVETRDVDTVAAHVDFRAVRASIAQQVVDSYLRLTGTKVSPVVRGLAVSGGSIADAIVAKVVTPEAFTDLLRTGWPNAVAAERPSGAVGLSTRSIGNAWQIFAASDYGFRRFDISVPPAAPREQQFLLTFRLSQWRWRLARVRLPERIQVQLAEALIKSLPKPPR
jgi:hypothetical protein